MIKYQLRCSNGHEFEGWFSDSAAYDRQAARRQVACPACADTKVAKAIMSPSVATRRDNDGSSAGRTEIVEALRRIRSKVIAEADYVGPRFAEEARRIHHEEAEARQIYGEATREEVVSLVEDGVPVLPLPRLPEDHN
jgi:hypothetical protein